MTRRKHAPAYPAELRERGLRLFREHRSEYASDTAACRAIAPKLGCSPDSLRLWCQQAERDAGKREGLTTVEKDRIRDLEREVRELRQANEMEFPRFGGRLWALRFQPFSCGPFVVYG